MRAKFALAAAAATAALLTSGGQVAAQRGETQPPPGYLTPGTYDALKVLAPAPAPGSPQAQADRQIFLATRALKDTPRWSLAQNDDSTTGILQDFSCALGFTPSLSRTPKMYGVMLRLRFDVRAAVDGPKDLYKRPRPYLVDDGPICIDRSESLARSPDYPSGHATWGWAMGMVLAQASPEQATQILARARAFGESRLVCGVHNASSVTAGQVNGAALMAAVNGSSLYRSDIKALRAEITAARKAGPAPDRTACAAEAALVAQPLL